MKKINPPVIKHVLHEIKIQVAQVEVDGNLEETVLVLNPDKIPFHFVTNMLSAAIVANIQMEKSKIKSN